MTTKEILSLLGINRYKPFLAKRGKKKCTICERTKSIYAFCNNSKYQDSHHPWCMECTHRITEAREIQQSFARPPWFNRKHEEQYRRLRREVARLNKATGIKHSVCHKEPIQHWLICGLDIPANMYVDTQANNAKESNFFLPFIISSDGKIEQVELSERSIIYAFKFNERFNQERNDNYRQSDKKCA